MVTLSVGNTAHLLQEGSQHCSTMGAKKKLYEQALQEKDGHFQSDGEENKPFRPCFNFKIQQEIHAKGNISLT